MTTTDEPIDIRVTVENGDISRIIPLAHTLTIGRQRDRNNCPTCSSRMDAEDAPHSGMVLGRTLTCPSCGTRHLEIKPAGIPHLLDHNPHRARLQPKRPALHVPEKLLVISRARLADSPIDPVLLQCQASLSRDGSEYDPWQIVVVDAHGHIWAEARHNVGVMHNSDGEAVLKYRPDPYTSQNESVLKVLVIRQPPGHSGGGGSTLPSPRWNDQATIRQALARLSERIYPNGELPPLDVNGAMTEQLASREWAIAITFFALQQREGATARMRNIGLRTNHERPRGLWKVLHNGLEEARRGLHFDAHFGVDTVLGLDRDALAPHGGAQECFEMVEALCNHGFTVPQKAMDEVQEMLGHPHA